MNDCITHRAARRAGFTLIEVLVVVAIIALLAAVLIPSLKKARDQVKTVACRTNLHDFGLAMQQYVNDHDPYYPLPSYIGSTIWYDNPAADDNLFVLWYKKYTPNIESFTCPATTHQVRKPERVEKTVAPNKGIQFDIYTGGVIRNDFEFHAQLVKEYVQLPTGHMVQVNGHGTSYEYAGWDNMSNASTQLDWYPFPKKYGEHLSGEPLKAHLIKHPAMTTLMQDADEGQSPCVSAPGYPYVVGAPDGAAHNNLPEDWDNHGAKLRNVLYADGHVQGLGIGYWNNLVREMCGP